MFWTSFWLGIVIGAMVGFMTCAILTVGKIADLEAEAIRWKRRARGREFLYREGLR